MNKHSHTILVGVVLGLFCLSLTLFHKSFQKRGRQVGSDVNSTKESAAGAETDIKEAAKEINNKRFPASDSKTATKAMGKEQEPQSANLSQEELHRIAETKFDFEDLAKLKSHKIRKMVEIEFDPFFQQISKERDFWIDPNPPGDMEDFKKTAELLTSKFSHLANRSNINHDRSLNLGGKNFNLNFYINAMSGGSSDSNNKMINYSVVGLYTSVTIIFGDDTYQSTSSVTRTDKAQGDYWVLHALAGCDRVIRDQLSAIAIKLPEFGSTRASVKILKTNETDWQNLTEGTWKIENFPEESEQQSIESIEGLEEASPKEYPSTPIKQCQNFG